MRAYILTLREFKQFLRDMQANNINERAVVSVPTFYVVGYILAIAIVWYAAWESLL